MNWGLNNSLTDADRFIGFGRDIANGTFTNRAERTQITFTLRRFWAHIFNNAKVMGNSIMTVVINGVKLPIPTFTIPAGTDTDLDSGEIAIVVNAGDLFATGWNTLGQGGGGIQLHGHWECFVSQNQGNRVA